MGALSSLKVLDFSTLLPGPLATMLLADLGADVISVSAPGKPDLMNGFPPMIDDLGISASVAWLGRNKRSINLNLKKPESVEAVKKLVKDYDIVVEQFRPGVMKRLGVDYETLKKENPALIYCSITGYGQEVPMSHKVGHDLNYLGISGNMVFMNDEAPQPVSIPNFQLADVAGGGYMSVIAILSAVQYREKTGKGQYIDLSLMDSIMPFTCVETCGVLASRRAPGSWKAHTVTGTANGPHYDVYETADKKYVSVGALEPKFFATLCKTLGFPQWADGKIIREDPETLRAAFKKTFKEKTRAEWTAIFSKVDACVEPVLDISEMCENDQVISRGMLPEVPLSLVKNQTVQQIGNPVKLSESPVEYRHTAFPSGYNTREVLENAGFDDEAIAKMSS